MKLNGVWQPVLDQDSIGREEEMNGDVKADRLSVCGAELVSEHLNLYVCGRVFGCLVALIIFVFITPFG